MLREAKAPHALAEAVLALRPGADALTWTVELTGDVFNVSTAELTGEEEDLQNLFIYADRLQSDGEHEAAIGLFDRIISVLPEATDALVGRGYSLCQLNRYEEALRDFQQAARLDPEDTHVQSNLALAYIGRGLWNRPDREKSPTDAAKAAECLERALARNPYQAESYFLRACLYMNYRMWNLVLADCDRCLGLTAGGDAIHARAMELRALALYSLGDVTRALEEFARWRELYPHLSDKLGLSLDELTREYGDVIKLY